MIGVQNDRMIIAASDRQRLLTRIDILVHVTAQYGHLEAIGTTMSSVAAKLRALWPETDGMPDNTAFRHTR